MQIWQRIRPGSSLATRRMGPALTLVLALTSTLILVSCASSSSEPTPAPGQEAPAPAALSERCRGDGAVQTWLLLPLDPPQSELMAAYQDRQVIEFQGTVIGQDDDPALQPHRRVILREAAEGITVTLDYQGDPPPLVQGQSYRFIAWADLVAPESAPGAAPQTADPRSLIPASRSYELQIYDSAGLLFLGLTDVDMQDDPLELRLEDVAGECAPVAVSNNPCVASRQVLPLSVRWGQQELSLHPGEDGQLEHQGAIYTLSVFRNRQVTYAETACAGYSEHQRSLRIARIDPPPVILAPPTPITSTLPLSATTPLSGTAPILAPSPSAP